MIKKSDHFIRQVSPSEREVVGDGVARQILGFNSDLMMVRVWFDKGAVGPVHQHIHSQVSYVESGRFSVRVGDDVQTLCAGDCFFIPPNVDHGAVCEEAGVLLDVFNPVRQDFLDGEGYDNKT